MIKLIDSGSDSGIDSSMGSSQKWGKNRYKIKGSAAEKYKRNHIGISSTPKQIPSLSEILQEIQKIQLKETSQETEPSRQSNALPFAEVRKFITPSPLRKSPRNNNGHFPQLQHIHCEQQTSLYSTRNNYLKQRKFQNNKKMQNKSRQFEIPMKLRNYLTHNFITKSISQQEEELIVKPELLIKNIEQTEPINRSFIDQKDKESEVAKKISNCITFRLSSHRKGLLKKKELLQ